MSKTFIILLMLAIFGLIGFTIYRQMPLLKSAFSSTSLAKLLPAKKPNPASSIATPTPTPEQPDYENNLAINDYLVSNLAISVQKGDIYCAYSLQGTDSSSPESLYLISMCEEFTRSQSGNLSLSSGQVIPVVLSVKVTGNQLTVNSHKTPQPGSEYSADVRKMFPEEIAATILSEKFAIISSFLQKKIDSQTSTQN